MKIHNVELPPALFPAFFIGLGVGLLQVIIVLIAGPFYDPIPWTAGTLGRLMLGYLVFFLFLDMPLFYHFGTKSKNISDVFWLLLILPTGNLLGFIIPFLPILTLVFTFSVLT